MGHLPWLMFDVHRFLERARRDHGPIYWLNYRMGRWMVLVDGEPGLELLRSRTVSASRGSENLAYILDDTMLVADGAEHRRIRGAMRAPFSHGGLTASATGESIAEIIDARLARWIGRREVALMAETGEIALDVIFGLMGASTTDLPRWRAEYRAFVLGALPGPGWLPGTPRWRALRARAWIDTQVRSFLAQVRSQGAVESLLGALTLGADQDAGRLTEPELMANLRVLGLAGHETTASTMAWAMLHLGADPGRWDRLVEEATGAEHAPVTPKDLRGFAFADAVFRECLRLYPPATILQRTIQGHHVVHGVPLPEGLLVGIPLSTTSGDPRRYPEPERFIPERWLDLDHRPGPTDAFQFGAGAHFCLGYHLALLEGIQFLVRAARVLAAAGLRPHVDRVPSPTYFPVVRPPSRARVRLVTA